MRRHPARLPRNAGNAHAAYRLLSGTAQNIVDERLVGFILTALVTMGALRLDKGLGRVL